MKTNRAALWGALLIILLSVSGTCLLSCKDTPPFPAPPVKAEQLALGLAIHPSSALVMIALEKGFFSESGLELTVRQYPSGKRALMEGLLTDSVDVSTSADVPVVFATLRGADVRILCSTYNADNINRIVGRRDASIEKPGDLAGKRLATQRASAVHFFLHLFLLEHNVSDSDVEMSYHKAEDLPLALANATTDAFSMREPYISQASQMLGDNALVFSAPGIYVQHELLLAREGTVRERPQAIKRLIAGLLKAEDFARANPTEAIHIVSKKLGVPPDTVGDLLEGGSFRVSLQQSMLVMLEDISRWAISLEGGNGSSMPDYLDIIYLQGLGGLKPRAVTIIQ